MADGTVTYLFPAWGLTPEKGHRSKSVHVRVTFTDDSPGPVTVVHNLDLPYGAPLQPNEWIEPIVIVNPIAAGPAAPQHVLSFVNGDSLSISRATGGLGTAVTYDIWILRHKEGWW